MDIEDYKKRLVNLGLELSEETNDRAETIEELVLPVQECFYELGRNRMCLYKEDRDEIVRLMKTDLEALKKCFY